MSDTEIPAVPALNADTIEKVRQLAQTLRADLDLHGEWGWFGDSKHGTYYLATRRRGRQFVKAFDSPRRNAVRLRPMFRTKVEGDRWPQMTSVDDITIHEVCPEATERTDPRLYRHDVIGFRSPVADWMSTVTPDVVLALLDLAGLLSADGEVAA